MEDRTLAYAELDAWLDKLVTELDGDEKTPTPARRAQVLGGRTTAGIILSVPSSLRDLVAPHVYEWATDLRAEAADYEERTRTPVAYRFPIEALDASVRLRLGRFRAASPLVEFREDKDTGMFLAYEIRVVGGPFRRDELPGYEEAIE